MNVNEVSMNNVSRYFDFFKFFYFFWYEKLIEFFVLFNNKKYRWKKNEINYCEIKWNIIIMKFGGFYYMSFELIMMGNGRII